jgi:ubiquitin-conjugating enzyme E2 O
MATRVLCTEDIVCRKGGSRHSVGNIERTHTDVDTHYPRPWQHEAEPILENDSVSPAALRKFKSDGVPPKGTVYVRWVFVERTELIAESQLELLHRSLFIGDIVNRTAEDPLSGVVLNVHTKCSLQPMGKAVVNSNNGSLLSLLPFEHAGDILVRVEDRPSPLEDIPVSELMYEEAFSEDDLVTYKGWLGRVMTMTTALTVRLTDNCVVEVSDEVCELLSDHPDVARAGDIVKTTKGKLRTGVWKFGKYNPNTPPIGSVVSTRATTVEVMWLQGRLVGAQRSLAEPPKVLERDELESMDFRVYDRSKRPSNVSQEMTVSYSEIEASISQRVRFRDLNEAATKYDDSTPHGKLVRIPRQDTLGYDMNVFEIKTVSADVTVQWQDLTVTREKAVELIPDAAIDDLHAAWPGEIAHTLTMKQKSLSNSLYSPEKVGVVQCVKPDERMAMIRWCPAASVTYSKAIANSADPGVTPQEELVETTVAIADGPTEELSLYDVDCPGALNVRRGDIALITSPELFSSFAPGPSDGSWLGEVVDTWLDGRLLIRLGASDVVEDLAVRREDVVVVVRSDDTQVTDGLPGDEQQMEEDSELDDSEANEWLSDDEEPQATYVDENGEAMDLDDVENEEWESDEDDDEIEVDDENAMADATPTAPDQHSLSARQLTPPAENTIPSETTNTPESYVILETPVPDDHPYRDQPSTSNPTVMKRTQKEHKILQSPGALPGGVYVRTWESRLDLFRVLFVGPEETPYARAPFIMDFCLPTDYPQTPPMAFFHSWLGESGMGGLGRVNPNLYEDGKICLSLLGTWDGDKAEAWNPVKSTLLQVIVSLLGLVLVPEPYFNEAGYEPLAGSASSKRPSALYNERTFLRSSSFLISAVVAVKENTALPGLQGVEDEVRWLYTHPDGPRLLKSAFDRVEDVLQRSEKDEKVEPDGATVMSKGACIPLRRVLNRLRTLMD